MYELRPYQREAVDATLRHFQKGREPALVVLPTGAGKSLVIAELAQLARGRVLVLAHVKELVEQNHAKYESYGLKAGIYSAGLERKDRTAKVIFGSIQSVARATDDFFDGFSLLVIDECHRVSDEEDTQYAQVMRKLREASPQLCVLGLTATPYRLGLGWIYEVHGPRRMVRTTEPRRFKTCVFELPLSLMIETGYLTPPIRIDSPVACYDFSKLPQHFTSSQVEDLLKDQARVTPGIIANIVDMAKARQGVMIFAGSVRHAEEVLGYLPEGEAALVVGETASDERDRLIAEFKAKKLKYLVNVSVLTTGFDAPHVDLIALLRPTESVALYQQIVGRGLRLAPGKRDCLILDYTGLGHDLFAPDIDEDKPSDNSVAVKVGCPSCGYLNDFWGIVDGDGDLIEHFGRRCRAVGCGFRFRFKRCDRCGEENDIAARACSQCKAMLVDPDKKLRDAMALKDAHVMRADSMQFVKNADKKGNERLEVRYYDADGQALREWYYLRTPSDRKAFYYNFMRMHLRIPERQLEVESPDDALAYEHLFRVPLFVIARKKDYYWQIREKIFDLLPLLLAVLVLATSSGLAAAAPSYDLSADLAVDPANNAASFKGEFRVKDWPADVDGRRCLFLPYNDTDYEFDPIRDFDLVPRRFAKPQRRRGRQAVQITTPGITQKSLSPQVIELVGAAGDVALTFEGAMPRWPDADRNEYVLADFHPQPLAACPARPAESRTFTAIPVARIEAKLTTPEGWYAASPAALGQFEGRKLVVAILRGFERETMDIGGLSVEVFSRSKDFRNLLATIGHALRIGKEIFGPLPFPRLVVLETSDVEKSSLPGVVIINRPHQAGMSELQGEILNWTDWQATSIVAEQWFGASATVASLDDLWLLRGFVDFATIEALASFEHRYSLFRHDGDPSGDQINFDYRQNQDLLAAALTYLQPYNALTSPSLESLHPFAQQNSLSYVRHALALRQINWTLGRDEFRALLRRFFAEARGKAVRPRDFGAFLKAHAPTAATYLTQWWATAEWPDFELLGVDEEPAPDGKGRDVTVTLSQHGGYSLPVTVAVKDEADQRLEAIAQPIPTEPGRWQAKIRTSAPVARVEIDPKRQVFDWDRFDNRDAWPAVRWLPGNARTLSDDAYTVIWLPLASALPGDPLTLQLVGQAFRYMHSSTTAILSYQPKTKIVGYSLYYLTDFPQLGGYLVADALQDKGLAFRGERAQGLGFYKTVSLIKDPYLEYGVRVRNREALGDPMTRHQTAAFKASATPLNQYDACRYNAKTELEHTIHARQDAQDYARNFLLADLTCKMGPWLEGTVRGFGGELTRDRHDFQGGNYRFHPQDASEARMRFDDPQLERADRIGTVGADLLVPMPLPIADAFYVLKRETRFRAFYDYGRSEHPNATYRDAGIGLWAPLGFDLVGKSSVALLNFSLLVVLYREAGDYRSRKPGVLFDFDFFGKL